MSSVPKSALRVRHAFRDWGVGDVINHQHTSNMKHNCDNQLRTSHMDVLPPAGIDSEFSMTAMPKSPYDESDGVRIDSSRKSRFGSGLIVVMLNTDPVERSSLSRHLALDSNLLQLQLFQIFYV